MTTTINDLSADDRMILKDDIGLLQEICRAGSVAKGFGDEGDDMRTFASVAGLPQVEGEQNLSDVPASFAQQVLANYYSKRLFLIVTEPVEAFDEVRSGRRAIDETYYPKREQEALVWTDGKIPADIDKNWKPEGVPSELADTVIRCFDLAAEAKIDLAAMILEKLEFNATRPTLHGKAF